MCFEENLLMRLIEVHYLQISKALEKLFAQFYQQ